MKRILMGMLLLGLSGLACADDAPSAEKLALAQQYFDVSGMQQLYANPDKAMRLLDKQLTMMEQNMPAVVSQHFHATMEKIRPRLNALTARYLEQMQPDLVQKMAQIYSEQDLKAQIAFYSSPDGKSVVAKNQELMDALSEVNGKYGAAMMQDLMAELEQAIQASDQDEEKPPVKKGSQSKHN